MCKLRRGGSGFINIESPLISMIDDRDGDRDGDGVGRWDDGGSVNIKSPPISMIGNRDKKSYKEHGLMLINGATDDTAQI